mgnify:CR=1 FL=1
MFKTAIQFIRFDKAKSIGIIVGIVISIFLIGQQLTTLQFLMDVMAGLINNAKPDAGEIWVIDNSSENTETLTPMDIRFVQEIRSVEGVESTYPVVVASAKMALKNGKSAVVTLVGSEAPLFVGGPDTAKIIEGNIAELANSKTVSIEYFDARKLDPSLRVGSNIEVNGQNAIIKATTMNAQAFGGHYMYTNINSARFLGNFSNDKVSVIVVKLKPGANEQQVINQINHSFFGIRAWDVEKLRSSTVRSILSQTNMGVTFGTLIIFAIVTGFFIIGLTMYSAVLDRIKDYGTLKAIGAKNGYVRRLILMQSIIFSVIGFTIALLLLIILKQGMANQGLTLRMNPKILGSLFLITLLISVGGSLFAIGKINRLEPASVFR